MLFRRILSLVLVAHIGRAAPPGFPASGNGIWYTSPGKDWISEYIPVGNGYLGATTPGGSSQEVTILNIESLWSGGPFQDPNYNGGNKQQSERVTMTDALKSIRQTIFSSGNGTIDNIEVLSTAAGAYGSYMSPGSLINWVGATEAVSDYYRWLDMDVGVARTLWTQGDATYMRELFCSYPSRACVQHLNSTTIIPTTNYTFNALAETKPQATCLSNNILKIRGTASLGGMVWEILASVQAVGDGAKIACNATDSLTATITVEGATQAWISWVGDTNYDMDAGNANSSYSFKGVDPHDTLTSVVQSVSQKAYSDLFNEHLKDYSTLLSSFSVDLGQIVNLKDPTDKLVDAYRTDEGDSYLEWVLFNYGRYLLAGSGRGKLPANLQGIWATGPSSPWSADYHVNINLQMNYWFAELTNMDATVTQSLWDYMEKTWAPRGAYTAQVLYNNSRGWVTHNELNIFGHTGMKGGGNTALWADYPAANAWMALHIWDHFDFTQDVNWWKTQGYPLLKGIALFHLDNLVPDLRSKDGELVVAPCNSPEQIPITYGCAHFQQLIWQLFNSVEKGFAPAGDTDTQFLKEVRDKRRRMDKGVRVGWWGEIMEWKAGLDSSTDTHRHISHLIGLYPGYALYNYSPSRQPAMVNGTHVSYTRQDVWDAAKVSLIHRGNGKGPDADAGWEKVWRAACWATLRSPDQFYHQLSYAVSENFAGSLFSKYNDYIFQIDANFGYSAAVLSGLLHTPDSPTGDVDITLLPALPKDKWSNGSLRGARIRAGMFLDLSWANGKISEFTIRCSLDHTQMWIWSRGRKVTVVNGQTGETLHSFRTGELWGGKFTMKVN